MIKNLSTAFIIVLVFSVVVSAQQKKADYIKKAPVILNEPEPTPLNNNGIPGHKPAANFVAVDTMANAFGPAIGALNPLAYDPWANVAAVVHRGLSTYALGSGQMWYNISTDKGVTWTRVNAGINTDPIAGRYPSMTISNPTKGTIDATTAAFSWPELNPSAFGFIGYGADQPVGNGTTFSSIIQSPPNYSSQVPNWASDNSDHVYWASDHGDAGDAAITFFRTTDFSSVDKIDPPQWNSAAFNDVGSITMGGMTHNGVLFYAVLGTVTDPDTGNPIVSGWYAGYSKSTDLGSTWSDWNVGDFRTLSATNIYDRMWDYKKGDEFVSYQGDMIVDNDGFVHMIFGVTDTTTDDNSGSNAIIEVYETASGWNSKVVADLGTLSDSTTFLYGSVSGDLNQMGPSAYLSQSPDGNLLAAQWVNGSATTQNKRADVFYSYRNIDGEWVAPINLTNTDGLDENMTHMSPLMSDNGDNTFTFFSLYAYDATGAVPADEGGPTVLYITPVTITVTDVNDPAVVNSFELEQNYPNPFNPATQIKYSISERSNVVLKVFDMLGREVSTIVNKTQEAGSYTINFDASDLASGMYVYSINAGNYSATKKMMLMK